MFREACWLIRHGVPFNVAFEMDDVPRTAMCIVFSEMEGNQFDWHSMTWKEQT